MPDASKAYSRVELSLQTSADELNLRGIATASIK
jgi:hypothetical protein